MPPTAPHSSAEPLIIPPARNPRKGNALADAAQLHRRSVRSERMMKRERRWSGAVIVQVFQCTASVTPGRHGTDGNPPRSIRRPFRLEEPFVSPLQRIPVNPAVNKGTDRLQIFPKGKRAGARVRLIGTPTCIEARRFEFSPCAPLPVENGEMILAAVFYRMRDKPWAAHCFLQRRQEQAFKSLDFRIPVGFLHHCESRKCDAGHFFL
jgi:hypothetical protein